MNHSAESVAAAVAAFSAGRVTVAGRPAPESMATYFNAPRVAVDATAIYDEWTGKDAPADLCDDHVALPPYVFTVVGMRLPAGVASDGRQVPERAYLVDCIALTGEDWEGDAGGAMFPWKSEHHEIPWDKVKHVMAAFLWVYSPEHGVAGPMIEWRIASDENGRILDVWYQQLHNVIPELLWNPLIVWLRMMTWLACRNVELVTPTRPRPVARRLARTGVDVKELWVRPIGKTYQDEDGQMRKVGSEGAPLSTVRGHLARYGIEGRGKLFGKITGTFWISPHVRGSEEHGVNNPTRIIETETAEGVS